MGIDTSSVVVLKDVHPSGTGRPEAARDLRDEFDSIGAKPVPSNVITPHDGHTFVANSAQRQPKGKAA
jgi:hypothetical protein